MVKIKLITIFIILIGHHSFGQNRIGVGVKANLGPYLGESNDFEISPGEYLNIGLFSNFAIDSLKKWSLGAEFLFNSSSFDFRKDLFSGSSEQFKINNVLVPIKAQYSYKKYVFSGGLINTFILSARVSNDSNTYIDGEFGNFNGSIVKRNYLQKKYDLQGLVGIALKLSHQIDIGVDISFYFDNNNTFTYDFFKVINANAPSLSFTALYHINRL